MDGALLFKMADPRIPFKCYGLLSLWRNFVVGLLEEFSFYEKVRGRTFDPVLAYLALRRLLEMDWERMCPAIKDPFVHCDWTTGEAFGLLRQLVPQLERDAGVQIVYNEHRVTIVAVKYSAGIWLYTRDDAKAWALRASGHDNHVPSQFDVEHAAVIDKLAGDRGENRNEGDCDLLRADRLVADVIWNEQQFQFRHILELGLRIKVTFRGNVMGFRLLKLVGDGFRTHAIRDRLALDAFNMRSKIVQQAEKIAS